MKKFIILSLSIFALVCTAFSQESKYKSPTLNLILELEQPNSYQKQQIIKLFDSMVSAAKKQNLTKKEDIFKLVNSKLPKTEIIDGSLLLKDLVPAQEGGEPESSFGYSARNILAYLVLEALNLNKGIYLTFVNGEILLAMPPSATSAGAGKQTKTVFYNLLEPNFLAKTPSEELLDSFTLYTQNDFKSLHLALAANTKYFEGKRIYGRDKADIEILREAENLAKQALKISPQNTQAIDIIVKLANYEMPYSFYNPDISKAEYIRKKIAALYDIQKLAIQVANQTNNFVAKSPDVFICNATPYCKNSLTDEMKKSMTPKNFISAVQNSITLRNYTAGVLANLYKQIFQDKDMFKTMAYIGNEYAKVKGIKQLSDIHVFYFQMAATSGILKNYQDFYKYKQLFDETYVPSDEYQIFDYANMMKNATVAVDIVTGKKSAEQFVWEYKNGQITDVHKEIIDGESVSNYYETQSILFAWDSYKNFVERVRKLAK